MAYEWEIGKAPQKSGVVRPAEAGDFRRFLSHGITPDGLHYWWSGPRRYEDSRRVELRRIPKGDPVERVPLRAGMLGSEAGVVLSPEGRYLYVHPGTDSTSQLYDMRSQNPPAVIPYSIETFSPDSRWIVAYHSSKESHLHRNFVLTERETQKPWLKLGDGYRDRPGPFAFSPDGRYLAWCALSGTITVTDLVALRQRVSKFEEAVLPK